MAIREVQVPGAKHQNVRFKESVLAHEWCQGDGVELGAAAHNSFNLPGSVNVAPVGGDDDQEFAFYKQAQIDMCGSYVEVDVAAEAHALPFDDDSLDYVISSHVVEHLPDPLGAFAEWTRVLSHGGVVFMIVPQPGAHPADAGRPIATVADVEAHRNVTVDTWDYEAEPVAGGRRGHYYVYDSVALQDIIAVHCPGWNLVATEDPDKKAGNGFTLVYVVNKPPREEERQGEAVEADLEGFVETVEEPEPPKKTRKRKVAEPA